MGHQHLRIGSRLVPFAGRLRTSLLRSGCADPVRARDPTSASDCRAEAREFPQALPKPASRFPASLAGWAGRFRPRSSPPSPLGPNPLSTRAVPAAPLSVTRDTRREGTRAPLLTPRSARRTRRSHNTHSGSSLSSSSLRGDDLHTVDTTEQVPGVGGGAKRCYPHTPFARFRQLVARLRRRIQHDPPDPRSASYETHSRTRVGGWVLRSGCADPVHARSPRRGPEPAQRGGLRRPFGRPPPPRYRTRPIAAPTSEGVPPGTAETRLPIPCISCRLGGTIPAALFPPVPLGT